MIFKNLKFLVIVFLIFSTAVFWPFLKERYWNGKSSPEQSKRLIEDQLTFENVSQISIIHIDSKVEIKRHDDGWKVNDKRAKIQSVRNFITSFNDVVLADVISRNPENHSGFGIDDQNGIVIDVYSQNKIYSVILGYQGDTASTFHIKNKDDDNLYLGKGEFYNFVSAVESDWLDRIAINIQKNSIKKIEFMNKGKVGVFEEGENGWLYSSLGVTSNVSDEAALEVVATFEGLETTGLADEKETATFEKATKSEIKVYTNEGLKSTIYYVPAGEIAFIAEKETPDVIYRILKYRFDAFNRVFK